MKKKMKMEIEMEMEEKEEEKDTENRNERGRDLETGCRGEGTCHLSLVLSLVLSFVLSSPARVSRPLNKEGFLFDRSMEMTRFSSLNLATPGQALGFQVFSCVLLLLEVSTPVILFPWYSPNTRSFVSLSLCFFSL